LNLRETAKQPEISEKISARITFCKRKFLCPKERKIMSEGLKPGEPIKSPEDELKEPTMKEWAKVYGEMQGVDPTVIEKELETFLAEVQETKEFQVLTENGKYPLMPIYGKEGFHIGGTTEEFLDEPGTNKAFLSFIRFSKEPDEDTLGEGARSSLEWEKTNQTFASPKEVRTAAIAYLNKTGGRLNERNITMCPGFRLGNDKVPGWRFDPFLDSYDSSEIPPDSSRSDIGVRRVITTETKTETKE
jgi:hypothetical protein